MSYACTHPPSSSVGLCLCPCVCECVCVSHQQFLFVKRETVLSGNPGVGTRSEAQSDVFMTRHKLLFYLIWKSVLSFSASMESIFNVKCQTSPLWHSGKLIPVLIVADLVAQSSSNGPREGMTAAATEREGAGGGRETERERDILFLSTKC